MPLDTIPRPMPAPSGQLPGATRTVWFRRRLSNGHHVLLGPVDAHIYPAGRDVMRSPVAASYKWAMHWDPAAEFAGPGVVPGHEQPEMGDELLSDYFLNGNEFEPIELASVDINVGGFIVMTAYFGEVAGIQSRQTPPAGTH